MKFVREAIGPKAHLMVDANQQLPIDQAAQWIDALSPFHPAWVEEPLRAEEHRELANVRYGTSKSRSPRVRAKRNRLSLWTFSISLQ